MIYILWDGIRIHHSRDVRITNQLWADYIKEQQQDTIAAITPQPVTQPIEPTSYQQAISLPEADKWQTSMEKELNALKKKETWIEIPKSEAKGKILSGKCHGMAHSAAIARDMLVCCSMVRWHVPYHGGPEAHL